MYRSRICPQSSLPSVAEQVRGCLRLNATVTHVSFISGDTTSPIGGVISGKEEEPEGGMRESLENEVADVDADRGGGIRVDFAMVGEKERRESVWADAVIVAVPLSLLQQGAVEFDPPIPEVKMFRTLFRTLFSSRAGMELSVIKIAATICFSVVH